MPRTAAQAYAARGLEIKDAGYGALGSSQAWLVPGAPSVCLLYASRQFGPVAVYGGRCVPTDEVLQRGYLAVQTTSSGGAVAVLGFVQNGVPAVILTDATGVRLRIPVHANMFAVRRTSGPPFRTISVDTENGGRSYTL